MYFEENLDRDALAVYFRHGYIQSIFLNMKELEVGISQRLQRNAVPEQMFKNSEEESADELIRQGAQSVFQIWQASIAICIQIVKNFVINEI